MERREVCEQVNVASVDWWRIEGVKRIKVCIFALSEANLATGREIAHFDETIINKVYTFDYVVLEQIITRPVICFKDGVSEVYNVSALNECGVICGLGLKGGVLVSAEVTVGTVEVRLKDAGVNLAVRLYPVCA